jgi:hypothetical protein
MILAPMVVKHREPEPGKDQPKEPYRVAGFRPAYVFDISQTEGKHLPEFAKTTGDPKDYTEKLKALAERRGITVEYDEAIKPAQGISSGGRIRLLPGLQPAEEFSTLAHELAHEMLHHGKDAAKISKVVREVQAEAVAYVVSRGIGLETNGAAADYIALYNGDKATLARSLAAIQDASTKILDDLLPEERHVPAPHQAEPTAPEVPSGNSELGQTAEQSLASGHQQPEQSPEPVTWDR